MGGCKTWCSANRRRGGALAALCRKNLELVKWGKCEVTKKVSGEGGRGCRPETNLMGKIWLSVK